MMLDLLAPSATLATSLIERTASTPGVQMALQSSLAPAFLLVGIGSVMNVMMGRLTWIAGRIERLGEDIERAPTVARKREVEWLCVRRHHARRAIMFSAAAAVTISVVIALLFVSTYIEAQIGTVIAALWVTTVACLITGLFFFLRETSVAARGSESFRKGEEADPV